MQFLGKNAVDNYWVGADGRGHAYFGQRRAGQCGCGAERLCGGHDGQQAMMNRQEDDFQTYFFYKRLD